MTQMMIPPNVTVQPPQPQLASQWYYTDQGTGDKLSKTGQLLLIAAIVALAIVVVVNRDTLLPALDRASEAIEETITGKPRYKGPGLGTMIVYFILVFVCGITIGVLVHGIKKLGFNEKREAYDRLKQMFDYLKKNVSSFDRNQKVILGPPSEQIQDALNMIEQNKISFARQKPGSSEYEKLMKLTDSLPHTNATIPKLEKWVQDKLI